MSRSDWVFEPKDFTRSLEESADGRRAPVRIPDAHVMVFGGDAFEFLRKKCHARHVAWDPSYAVGTAGRRRVGIHRVPAGAPAAVIALEEAAVLGAKTVLLFGSCGSLVPDLRIGALVVPTRGYSDEGTSRHYGGKRWSEPDHGLARSVFLTCQRHGLEVRTGGVWTTDAPYRESRARVKALVARGVVGVDMEAAALFTVARFRRVRIAGLFVVSDELAGDAWNPGFFSMPFAAGKRRALRAVMELVAGRFR